MSILCYKFTHLEKCDCVFCTSKIPQNSHSQFIFTKLFFVCLNAAKAYCSESQSCVIPSWSYCHQQRLHRQILCRLCGKFKFFVLVFKVWHRLAECYPWLSRLLPRIFFSDLLLPCQFTDIFWAHNSTTKYPSQIVPLASCTSSHIFFSCLWEEK